MPHLADVQVVQAKPLYVEQAPKAVERIAADRALASHSSHPGIPLEGVAFTHREQQNDGSTRLVRIVQLLLIPALGRPGVALHGLHQVLPIVAR